MQYTIYSLLKNPEYFMLHFFFFCFNHFLGLFVGFWVSRERLQKIMICWPLSKRPQISKQSILAPHGRVFIDFHIFSESNFLPKHLKFRKQCISNVKTMIFKVWTVLIYGSSFYHFRTRVRKPFQEASILAHVCGC